MFMRDASRRPISRTTWLAAALLAGSALAGFGTAEAAPLATMTAHVPSVVTSHHAALVTSADPNRVLHLAVALPMRNQAALDALLRQIYDPSSANYRHYLSVAEFTDRFGPTTADYDSAVKFFAASGLQVTGTAANRYMIDVAGRVADVARVLHVGMNMYKHPTQNRLFIAPDREPTLNLPVSILHISGLDDYELPTTRLKHDTSRAAKAGTGSGPSGNFLGSDVRTAYYSGSLTGTGQSVGLMELGGYNIADVNTYFSKFGPPLTTAVVGISTDGSSLSCSGKCDDSEQVLDIEYTIAIAPGLKQVVVYVANTAESVLNRMVSDNSSKQLSTSWGWNESFGTDDAIFKEMAAQGQTFLTASGDNSSLKASGPWPEEDANLTAVGGTDLTTSGKGGPWAGETGWSGSAGGPSLDKTILIQKYQLPFINTTNKGSKKVRNVPDIAGDANTDNYICANGTCTGGYGGTSFASPIWAGFVALDNQQAAASGKPAVGFLNPTLYALAGGSTYHSILHDVTSGKSGVYTATANFDLVTGLGSPEGAALINALTP